MNKQITVHKTSNEYYKITLQNNIKLEIMLG